MRFSMAPVSQHTSNFAFGRRGCPTLCVQFTVTAERHFPGLWIGRRGPTRRTPRSSGLTRYDLLLLRWAKQVACLRNRRHLPKLKMLRHCASSPLGEQSRQFTGYATCATRAYVTIVTISFPWRNSPQWGHSPPWARASSLSRFHDYTQTHRTR
jgi:hypothetical protein